jgi:hypothetical protein
MRFLVNKSIRYLCLFSLLQIPCVAYAQSSTGIAAIKNTNNAIGVQAISTNVNYTETVGSKTLDTEQGYVPGFAINVSFMQDWLLGNDYVAATYSQSTGNTNYTGSYIGSSQGYGSVKTTSPATLTDFGFRYGKGFALNDQVMATPFIELGSHQWNRNLGSYQETYTNNYYGLGLLGQVAMTNAFVLSASALVGNTANSNISISGSPYSGGALGNSTIYRLGISGDYAFTKSLHGNIGLDYTSFSYGQSTPTRVGRYVYNEPNSTSQYATYKVGLSYNF